MYLLTKFSKVSSLCLYWGCASVISLPRCLSFIHLSQVVLWYGTAVCLSVHPSIHSHLSVRPFTRLSARPSIHLVCRCPYRHMYMSFIHPSQVVLWYGTAVCLSVHPSIHSHLSVRPSARPSIHLVCHCPYKHMYMSFIHLSQAVLWYGTAVCLSVHPSIHSHLSVRPSARPSIHLVCRCPYRHIYMSFYPRPVLAFGYCRCLRLSVCVSVCVRQPWACPRHKSPRVQARTTKFGQKVQTTWLRSLLFWGAIDLDLQGQI